jgi:4-azaleucine resistance transporter AzlC
LRSKNPTALFYRAPVAEERGVWVAAAPVVVAVAVFGASYGVLATAAGLAAWQVLLMSALVFAGSAQFAFVAVVAAGGGPASAVLSGALLNTRYVAIGAAAARTLPGSRLRRFLGAQLVVDESFAIGVGAGSAERPDARAMLVSGAALWLGWMAGSTAGVLIGPALGDPETLGLDAAFPALFVALLWPMVDPPPRAADLGGRPEAELGPREGRRAVRAALAGTAAALVLEPLVPSGLALAGAAVAGLAIHRT